MKQVLIVGGTGGLGSALVRQHLNKNVQVVVAGRSKTAENRVRRSYVIDATCVDWGALYANIERESGSAIDAVIFVAGTAAYGRTASFLPQRERDIFELNFWACANAARAVAEHWAENRLEGTFVAVLSIVARRAVPFEAYYSASKAAAARFLECLDLEYSPKRIRFLSVYPGTLDTPFRQRAVWYGMDPPTANNRGADVERTAQAICKLLDGTRRARVIGWRERVIDLADRLAPSLYDRMILRKRVAKALKEDNGGIGLTDRSLRERRQPTAQAPQPQGQK